MTKTIIVPVDSDATTARAIPIAASLAQSLGADLVLTTVGSFPARAHRELLTSAQELGVHPDRIEVLESNDVAAALAELVGRNPDPVVCMATHGRGHVGPPVLGSVAEELMHDLTVPFVLVGPRCASPWPEQRRRLVVCLDESDCSEAVLDPAVSWARTLGWELWLTEVFHPQDLEGAQHPDRYVDSVVERIGDAEIQTRVAFASDVPHAILHVARAEQAAMLAMGTHGRSGLGRLVLGSITMEVVHQAKCPVLVIRRP